MTYYFHGGVAQLVEQRTHKPRVGGSIPPPAMLQTDDIMPHIGKVKLGAKPAICAVLQEHANAKILNQLKKSHIQLIELRIDKFNLSKIEPVLKTLKALKKSGFSIIGTIRIKKEGGYFTASENKRLELFQKVIPFVDAVDVELRSAICKSVVRLAKKKKKPVIISFHDFKKTPSDQNLASILKKSKQAGADIVKIAATAGKRSDLTRILNFLAANRDKNLIIISMGTIGTISRLVFPFLGSLVSYGFVSKSTAPGQLPAGELSKVLTPSFQ